MKIKTLNPPPPRPPPAPAPASVHLRCQILCLWCFRSSFMDVRLLFIFECARGSTKLTTVPSQISPPKASQSLTFVPFTFVRVWSLSLALLPLVLPFAPLALWLFGPLALWSWAFCAFWPLVLLALLAFWPFWPFWPLVLFAFALCSLPFALESF